MTLNPYRTYANVNPYRINYADPLEQKVRDLAHRWTHAKTDELQEIASEIEDILKEAKYLKAFHCHETDTMNMTQSSKIIKKAEGKCLTYYTNKKALVLLVKVSDATLAECGNNCFWNTLYERAHNGKLVDLLLYFAPNGKDLLGKKQINHLKPFVIDNHANRFLKSSSTDNLIEAII